MHRSSFQILPQRLFIASLLLLLGVLLTSSVAQEKDRIFTQKPEILEAKGQPAPKDQPKPDRNRFRGGPAPEWIWGQEAGRNYVLRKEFMGGSESAWLKATCDNQMTLTLNGKRIAESDSWENPVEVDVQKHLVPGKNVILVDARNQGGAAGFALKLVMKQKTGKPHVVVSDKSWQAAESKDAKTWQAVKTLGKMGVGPWNNVFAQPGNFAGGQRGIFNLLPGFQVERLFTVPRRELGSWVSITFDDKGRLLASDQGGQGICRITPPKIGGTEPTKVEHLKIKMSAAQGMLYAFGSLYFSVNGGPGSGLYRARDTNGDDQFNEVVKLKSIQGGGEHGPHALRLSPDGKSIYLIAGNHTRVPQNFDASRLPRNWDEDLLLPRQWDARGHARGILAPGGWIAKTDPDGKTWEIISSGYRNPYDMDFNADGELFAYDADMEWDMGAPWYRPTRVVHATSGSEFGWRSGTGKWPTWYVDSLPELVDIGPGSPVGATFGYGTKFPAKYQKALYILDWTFGTMYAIHIEPDGASYKATKEEFVSRTPLPLTDAAVGPDGALYFTIGGRGAQSELFRVTYVGKESTKPVDAHDTKFADLRKLRHELEAYQQSTKDQKKAVDFIWPQLSHKDRHIRYAARVALEHQDAKLWQDKALAASEPDTLIQTAVALARQGDKSLQSKLISALEQLDIQKLSERQQLDLLRAWQLVFIRMGEPSKEVAARIAKKLDALYPAKSDPLNRELSQLLVYLQSPTVAAKTIALMKKKTEPTSEDMAELLARNRGYGGSIAKMLANMPDKQKLHYAFVLRNLKTGWTVDQRKFYFEWLSKARGWSGGASYEGFINNIDKEAFANATDAERLAIEALGARKPYQVKALPKPKGPGRAWTVADVLAEWQKGQRGRNFENGRRAFSAARCIVCHRFAGDGGATGPDLTQVAGRFNVHDLTEALIEPSKVISDQYQASIVETSKGKTITGRIVSQNDKGITIVTDPEDSTKVVDLKKSEIDNILPSKVSLMPADLLKPLSKEEVLDLLAYLISRGNPRDPLFRR